MASALELRINIQGGTEIAARFARAGDAVRGAVKEVLGEIGSEIASNARSMVPAKRARGAVFYRLTDRGAGPLSVIVNMQRKFRWVEQFEYGTVGAGPDAKFGTVDMGVRSYTRRASSRDVFQVVGRTKRELVASGFVRVHSYTHKFHMPTHPFMGPAFEAVKGEVVPRIQAAAGAALVLGEGT